MNKFIDAMTDATNFGYTENGAIKRNTTKSDLLDMFAFGGAYRSRSDVDVILLFKNAYAENPAYALKCLFYLRDILEGQGERRFFRTCMHWLAKQDVEAVRRNLRHIPLYGRWDDLYCFVDTPIEQDAFDFMKEQLALDVTCKTPSLLAKWLASENTSSQKTRNLAHKTRVAFGMTHKQYRKTLSLLRERLNIVERLMSANEWDKIEYDKIPSRAGMLYKNAFARHDIERLKKNPQVQSYADFAKDETKSVNARALYPYECVAEALRHGYSNLEDTSRLMTNKYWDNLHDYFQGAALDGMCVVDVSGSMYGTPIQVAISLGLYCAEKAQGPYHGHFITFSERPQFVKVEGIDFCDKVNRMIGADWGMNTNIEAVFDLMLNTARNNHLKQDEIPQRIIVVSDMEFDSCATSNGYRSFNKETLFETMRNKWRAYGYEMPALTFWNVDARSNNVAMRDDGNIQYVSGMSPVIFEQVMKNLGAYDLMMDKLNSDRYSAIG